MLHTMLDAWTSLAFSPFAPVREPAGGEFLSCRYHGEAGTLRYKLFIPSQHDGTPLPLVLMLHGGGQDADDFALGTGMNRLAEEHGLLVAYPEQPASANWGRCWNWFDDAHHHRGKGEPALLAAVAREIMADYAVDPARVYVAGLSAGGAMAVILGRTYPDLFAAAGCHSGLAHGSATDCHGATLAMRDGAPAQAPACGCALPGVPVIVFHGDLDTTVHPNNSLGVVRQSIDSHAAVSSSTDTGERGGRGFTRQVHRGHAGRIVAEHWTVHGIGHAWSGGHWRGSHTDPGGPDASREMLRFFLRHANRHADNGARLFGTSRRAANTSTRKCHALDTKGSCSLQPCRAGNCVPCSGRGLCPGLPAWS